MRERRESRVAGRAPEAAGYGLQASGECEWEGACRVKYDEIDRITGPALLVAAPGTGKTWRLAHRVKYLVEECGVLPEEVTVITFTRAAAQNMRSRLCNRSGAATRVEPDLQPHTISTTHSLGDRILREHSRASGVCEDFGVLASREARAIVIGDAAQLAGRPRSDGEAAAECRQRGDCKPEKAAKCAICEAYRRILRACRHIDHDDQILLACDLLRRRADLLSQWRRRTKHLLVDEYQDINAAQFELIKLLSGGQTEGLFVVGDDDQTIYSWRGTSPLFIRGFRKHFGKRAKSRVLTKAFRCPPNILKAGLAVLSGDGPEADERLDKRTERLSFKKPDGPPILIHSAPSAGREAAIVSEIARGALDSGNDVLVLVPSRAHARALADRFRATGMPFESPDTAPGAALPWLDRLRDWLKDPADNLAARQALELVLTGPVLATGAESAASLAGAEAREVAYAGVSQLWGPVISERVTLWESLERASREGGVLAILHGACLGIRQAYDGGDTAAFLGCLTAAGLPWGEPEDVLDEAASWLERGSGWRAPAGERGVRVMTMAAAKGLEAHTVCVVGLEDGTVPSARRDAAPMEEQLRQFYVCMTRASAELHLFHSRTRPGNVSYQALHPGDGTHMTLKPSPFLARIPEELCEHRWHAAGQGRKAR